MNSKKLIATSLGAVMMLAGAASADLMRGKVYQVSGGDVYVTMADSTVARVPAETAHFYYNGTRVPWSTLRTGQNIVVDYTPVYGFQRFYYDSAGADDSVIQTYLVDIDPATSEYIEYNGRLYHIIR